MVTCASRRKQKSEMEECGWDGQTKSKNKGRKMMSEEKDRYRNPHNAAVYSR